MKKLKITAFLAFLAAISLLVSGCGKKEEIIMATEGGFAPYEYYNGTDIVGVDVDIAMEIAKDLNKTLRVIDMEFTAITAAVDSGQADFGAAGMSITPDRLEEVDFSIEYAHSRQVVVVRNNSPITSPAGVDGMAVGVQLGTTADFYIADEMPGCTLRQYNKYLDAVNDLVLGRIDCIVMDNLPAQRLVESNQDIKILPGELFTDSYAIAVKKGNTELLNSINQTLQRLIDEGKIDEYTINHTTK